MAISDATNDPDFPESFVIPDVLADWPFKRNDNTALDQVRADHRKWFSGLKTNEKYKKTFEGCDAALLCAIAYPTAPPIEVRIGADLLYIEFIFDDLADNLNPEEAQKASDIIKDVLKNPKKTRPEGEDIIGAVIQDFWLRATDGATETLRWKLNKEFIGYVDAICAEGVDRDNGSLRDIDSYMQLRKTAIGVLPAISICLHGIDIPREAFEDPKIRQIEVLAGRLAFLTNDMTSYNVEQARGDDLLNSVALVKRTQGLSIQEAFDAVAKRFLTYAEEFLDIIKLLPLDSDPNLKAYVHCCGYWATAAHEWAFEIGRYRLSPDARNGGRVQVLPKKVMSRTSN